MFIGTKDDYFKTIDKVNDDILKRARAQVKRNKAYIGDVASAPQEAVDDWEKEGKIGKLLDFYRKKFKYMSEYDRGVDFVDGFIPIEKRVLVTAKRTCIGTVNLKVKGDEGGLYYLREEFKEDYKKWLN